MPTVSGVPLPVQLSTNTAQLLADLLGIAGDRHLHASPEAPCGQSEQQCLQEQPDAEGIHVVQVVVHAHDACQRCSEELPIAKHRNASGFGVVPRDPIDPYTAAPRSLRACAKASGSGGTHRRLQLDGAAAIAELPSELRLPIQAGAE